MQSLQHVAIFLALVALAFAPMVLARARRLDAEPQPASPAPADPTALPGILSGREALAYNLYGQAVGWMPYAMVDYDSSPLVQETWLQEADRVLDRRVRLR